MTRTIRIPRLFHRRARAFLADAKGLAAIEMALILPIALMLMSLVVYGGQAYSVQRRVTLAATTAANIFAQANNNNQSTITAAELNQILAYPNLILYPYDASAVQVVVSQLLVTVNGNGTATGTVCGSWANANGTPLARSARNCRSILPSPPPFPARAPMTIPLAAVSLPIPSLPITSFSARCSIRSSRPGSGSQSAR